MQYLCGGTEKNFAGRGMTPQRPDDITQADWFQEAAAHARVASRRYWAKGGKADQDHPRHDMPYWPGIPTGKIDAELVERSQRRRMR
jgi:hypothetical protein